MVIGIFRVHLVSSVPLEYLSSAPRKGGTRLLMYRPTTNLYPLWTGRQPVRGIVADYLVSPPSARAATTSQTSRPLAEVA